MTRQNKKDSLVDAAARGRLIALLFQSGSFRNGCYRWIFCIEGSIYSFGYSLLGPRRTAESVMNMFGFIRSGKGEIFLRKPQRNETMVQLSDLERQRQPAHPFCFDVSMNSKDD